MNALPESNASPLGRDGANCASGALVRYALIVNACAHYLLLALRERITG
jgi:hypothetical protein